MTIKVGIGRFDAIGKRVAEAVHRQSDMILSGVCAPADRKELIRKKWDCAVSESACLFENPCDIFISDHDQPGISAARVLYGSKPDSAGHTFYPRFQDAEIKSDYILIPDVDLVAASRVLRVLHPLGEIRSCFSTVITCHQYESGRTRGYMDSLEPVFGKRGKEWTEVLGSLGSSTTIRRVCAPCTRSDLHMFMIDFADSLQSQTVIDAFLEDSRFILGSSGDGFVSTADIHEFCRDLGYPRGDRHECFIWEESVLSMDNRLVFMMDVCPESALVPEIIDAARMLYSKDHIPPVSESEARARTDDSLGLHNHHRWGAA